MASVLAYYKSRVPISKIRQYATTDQKGTNILGMLNAAEKLGFTAKGVKGEIGSLSKIPKPAIAHVIVNKTLHHFVVLYKVTDQWVQIMDPADGRYHKLSLEKFKEQWTGVLVLLAPSEQFEQKNERIPVLRRFFYLMKPHRSTLIQASVGAVLYTILGLSVSIYVQKIVDHVLVSGNENLLNLLSILMLIILAFQIFLGSSKSILTLKSGQLIDARLILGYYKHLMRLPQSFFDTMRVGEIISRINDAVKIRAFINDVSISVLVNVLVVLFSFGLMSLYHWKLALIMLLVIPLYSLIYWITNRVNRQTQRGIMEKAADLESHLVESVGAMATIKRFGLEGHAGLKTETRFVKLLDTIYTSGRNSIFSGNATELVSRLFTIILLWVGSYFVIDREITPGELLSFYALIGYLTGPVSSLIGMNKTVQDALIAADRLFELIDLEREKTEGKVPLTREMLGDIHLEGVSFRYGSRKEVFKNLNLSILQGEFTAIVGESGSGKTTLISLLQKIYPVNGGAVKIGDLNISHIEESSLRRLVGVVPQDIHLFDGTVIENIAVGEYEPDLQRIVALCKALGMIEFIEGLPSGLATQLGERGASLSGGQRQKLAIARALYRQPEILILDEATSALDSASENHIQRTIAHLQQQGKTIIVIAHRLSTVMRADKICVLEKGELVEEGSHTALMQREGKYYNFWAQQMPGEKSLIS